MFELTNVSESHSFSIEDFVSNGMDCEMGTVPQDIASPVEEAIAVLYALVVAGHSLVLTLSGGKDSMTTTILGVEAIRRAAAAGIVQARHSISSASTGVENPTVENHLWDIHDEIQRFASSHALPIDVMLATPALASTFVVSTIGRGTLPRFPENGKARSCSSDWKVRPQQRLAASLAKSSQALGFRETVTVLGTRFGESGARAARMTARGESNCKPVRDAKGYLTISVICDWSLDDVWETLACFLDADTAPFQSFTDGQSIARLLEMYRDANEGTCGIVTGDDGNKAPCGPRFGCWLCTVVAEDKSMMSMLAHPQYRFMEGLNRFRNLLVATQYDMSRRELVGRSISPAGYLPVRPDVYSLSFRRDLLAYLITLDVLEEERAEALADAIAMGEVEDTPENQRLADVQFANVSLSQLVVVDFHWSLHHYAPHAFPAVSLWHEIRVLGRRYPVPAVSDYPKVPIPEKRWFEVGAFDRDAPADGLRSYVGEQWSRYLHPKRPIRYREVNGERTVWFEEEDSLEVDAEAACAFITCEFASMSIASQQHVGIESARFWLDEEIIKLPAGMAGRYQHMAKRGQYFANLLERLNVSPAELDEHLVANSIVDTAHELKVALVADMPSPQASIF